MKVKLLWVAVAVASIACAQQDGAALFQKHCAMCHQTGSATRAPLPDAMRSMTPEAVLAALESGSMKPQAAGLSAADRQALAHHIGLGAKLPAEQAGMC